MKIFLYKRNNIEIFEYVKSYIINKDFSFIRIIHSHNEDTAWETISDRELINIYLIKI